MKDIIAYIIAMTAIYCGYALYWTSFNPVDWSWSGRGWCAALIVFFAIGIASDISDSDK